MYSLDNEKLITVKDAAAQTGKNPETIRRWIWSGKLPAEKLGNQLFIRETSLIPYRADLTTDNKLKQVQVEKFLLRAKAFREKLRARGMKPHNSAILIREMREERMRDVESSLR